MVMCTTRQEVLFSLPTLPPLQKLNRSISFRYVNGVIIRSHCTGHWEDTADHNITEIMTTNGKTQRETAVFFVAGDGVNDRDTLVGDAARPLTESTERSYVMCEVMRHSHQPFIAPFTNHTDSALFFLVKFNCLNCLYSDLKWNSTILYGIQKKLRKRCKVQRSSAARVEWP